MLPIKIYVEKNCKEITVACCIQSFNHLFSGPVQALHSAPLPPASGVRVSGVDLRGVKGSAMQLTVGNLFCRVNCLEYEYVISPEFWGSGGETKTF